MLKRRGAAVRALLAAVVLAAAVGGCGDRKDRDVGRVAARVDRDEITMQQVALHVPSARAMTPAQAEAAARQALERLIDQRLAVRRADDLGLDRDPRVQMLLEEARAEVLARAYAERVGEGAAKPSDEEIERYYRDNPALFAERRVYHFHELLIEVGPGQADELRGRLEAARSLDEFVDYLRERDLRFVGSQVRRSAEQLPRAALDAFARLRDGQALLTIAPGGAQVMYLVASQLQPVSLESGREAVEQLLLNERRRRRIEDDLKALRAAARIEYVGRFAEPASAAAAASVPAADAASSSASSSRD